MTPEERAAIEARDKRHKDATAEWHAQAVRDRHALLDELRRVEQQRDRAMALCQEIDNLLAYMPYEGCADDYTAWLKRRKTLQVEIDGEKEEPTQ